MFFYSKTCISLFLFVFVQWSRHKYYSIKQVVIIGKRQYQFYRLRDDIIKSTSERRNDKTDLHIPTRKINFLDRDYKLTGVYYSKTPHIRTLIFKVTLYRFFSINSSHKQVIFGLGRY